MADLSVESLEDLIVLISNLTDSRGLRIAMQPSEILIGPVMEQVAAHMLGKSTADRLRDSLRKAAEPVYHPSTTCREE